MKKKVFLLLCALALLCAAPAQVISQQVFGSAGASLSGGGVQAQFTIGETFVSTASVSSKLLTQGFHQFFYGQKPKKATVQPPIVSLSVYPNPATNLLNISLSTPPKQSVWVGLYSSTGQLCKQANFTASKFQLNVSTLRRGAYILRVQEAGQLSKTIPFVKN